MKHKLLLIISLLSVLPLAGCAGGEGGGGFDIVKFLQNPFVMILLAGIIVYYMLKRK